MQRFECPFCGVRDETEFTYLTEAGIKRPEPSEGVSAEAWAHYLYMRRSPEGHAVEIWLHGTCGEYFRMTRDTVSREVIETNSLAGDDPKGGPE